MTETKSEGALDYFEDFKKLKSDHPMIQDIINNYSRIFEEMKIPLGQNLINIKQLQEQIEDSLDDKQFGYIFKNMPLLSITYPNYNREQKNINTIYQRVMTNFVKFSKELIEGINQLESSESKHGTKK